MTKIAIDLTRTHFKRQSRGFRIHGTWLFDQSPEMPCLVITPVHRVISHERTMPFVVPLSSAFTWNEPEHAAKAAGEALAAMQLEFSEALLFALMMAVHDHLGDLIAIPPYYGEAKAVADIIVTDQDGRQRHAVVMDRT